jgi:glycosyltransferase involved in cell wall biosynthesis
MSAPFPCTSHGILSPQELAELYRRAKIGICFSSTNYSLVPQEMMACGLPVIEMEGESTRSVFPPEAVTFTGPHPLTIADDIVSLLNSAARRKRQVATALQWVSEFSWEKSAKAVERALLERLRKRGQTIPHRRTPTASSSMATVCIPTYNGGDLLVDVVRRILDQRVPWPFDIVIVDSSSCDGSIDRCASIAKSRNANLRIKTIDKDKFQHGRTRNLCVDLSTSEFVCFLTQDAQPIDEFWLYNMVNVVGRFPRAAGGFGRHMPWPSASPFTKRDIDAHFSRLSQYPLVLSRETNPALWQSADEDWLQTVHYFSDNNSCIRRSVWARVPFPEIDYGEDQAWADRIIRLGFEKVYVPAAAVYHSHDWSPTEACQRAETEAYYFATVFGYRLYDLARTFEEQLEELHSLDRNWARQEGLSAQSLERQLVLDKAILTGRANGMRKAASRAISAD